MSWADVARRMPPVPMLPGETLGQWRGLGADERSRRADEAWAAVQAAPFPLSWLSRLLDRWRERRAVDAREANLQHLQHCRAIGAAHQAGVRADAGDADIVQEARESARDMERRLQQRDIITPAGWPDGVRLLALWAEVQAWLTERGLLAYWQRPAKRSTLQPHTAAGRIEGMLKRTRCERRWRAVLRRVHARAVEATARAIGLVSKRAGCYVSEESMRRRASQRARNAAALESVVAVNDRGQDYTLAELAARGPANAEIRRHELMTRIAGFEVVARDCGHEALFVTVTCPSSMHAVRTSRDSHGVEPNPNYDGRTQPDEAQQYLVKQWARFRSACDRWGLAIYGFRIAEPNHDGTPHWHALLFLPPVVAQGKAKRNRWAGRPVAMRLVMVMLRRYFWRKAGRPDETGARRHRVKVERIDWKRGSAAGYVAKYVAKNIDGYRVEKDLYGNEAMSASRRVDAWASTWRIRQFQQVGGAPVTVWRELRRLHPDQAAAAPLVALALDAANVASEAEDIDECHDIARTETAAHGWAGYLELQGGARVARKDLRIRLLKETTGELGRYGEPLAARTVGVVTQQVERQEVPPVGIVLRPMHRTVVTTAEVESERCTWITVARDAVAAVVERIRTPEGGKVACPRPDLAGWAPGQVRRAQGQGAAGSLPPWSPVNNCTREPEPLFAPLVRRARKVGRWHAWRPKRGPGDATRSGDAVPDATMQASGDDAGSGAEAW